MTGRRRWIRGGVLAFLLIAALLILFLGPPALPPLAVTFSQSKRDLEAYDFVEMAAQVSAPHAYNPFTGAALRGTLTTASGSRRWQVEGFWMRKMAACTGFGSCPHPPATTPTRSSTGRDGPKGPLPAFHVRSESAAARSASIRKIAGTLSGKARANTISSTVQRPIG